MTSAGKKTRRGVRSPGSRGPADAQPEGAANPDRATPDEVELPSQPPARPAKRTPATESGPASEDAAKGLKASVDRQRAAVPGQGPRNKGTLG